MRRGDDPNAKQFRAKRIYFSDGSWWVATREGERGPFPTKELAVTDANNYGKRKTREQGERPEN